MAGEVIGGKKMKASRDEQILKELLQEEKDIQKKREKLTNKLVLSGTLKLWKHPISHREILGILEVFLNRNSHRWVDIEFCFLNGDNYISGLHNNYNFTIYLFGRWKFILENIEGIAGRIANQKTEMMDEAGISWNRDLSIPSFIKFDFVKL